MNEYVEVYKHDVTAPESDDAGVVRGAGRLRPSMGGGGSYRARADVDFRAKRSRRTVNERWIDALASLELGMEKALKKSMYKVSP